MVHICSARANAIFKSSYVVHFGGVILRIGFIQIFYTDKSQINLKEILSSTAISVKLPYNAGHSLLNANRRGNYFQKYFREFRQNIK